MKRFFCKYSAVLLGSCLLYPLSSLSAAMFHIIDTTFPLLCAFSSQFQNRVMVEGGRVQTVIAADEERLSILMEETSGQAFICARDSSPQDTTISIITESGLVQDLQITFIKRSSEVVILTEPVLESENLEAIQEESVPEINSESRVLAIVDEILAGNIPDGFLPCQIQTEQWRLKKGIILEAISQLVGECEVITVYKISNNSRKKASLCESELQSQGWRWVFLETNRLLPKQTMVGMIAVSR